MIRPKKYYRHTTPTSVRAMRELYFVGKLKQKDIARMFGIKQNTVSRIVSGITWSNVE